jgi:hypothetical protein
LARRVTSDDNRACANSTIRTTFGIVFMQLGHADDEYIHATLTGGGNGAGRPEREAEFNTWTRTHDPYAVGNQHLGWCLANPAPALPDSKVASCLRVAEPSALLAYTRSLGRSRLEAMVQIKERYPARFTVPQLEALADRVYSTKIFPEDLSLQIEEFAQCLREDSSP